MIKNTQKNYKPSDACIDLCYVGKIHICNMDYDNEAGKSRISLIVSQKKKKTSGIKGDIGFATYNLNELGFKNISVEGRSDSMVIADIVIKYDINTKPYTIINADLQEIKSLKEVMDYSRATVCICRNEPKFEKVLVNEFKNAVTNYITQRQM